MSRVKNIMWLAGVLCALLAGCARGDVVVELEEGWREFRFQTYKEAEERFLDVEARADHAVQRAEASIGLAMTAQYRDQKRDPVGAAARYRGVIDSPETTADQKDMARNLLALLLSDQGALEEANGYWQTVIDDSENLLLAQDALLRRTIANTGGLRDDQSLEALRFMEEKRRRFPRATLDEPGLAPIFEQYKATVHFWREEYEQAREALVQYIALTTTKTIGYNQRASSLMRIARISELHLDDPATAGAYYRRLVLETPNDVRAYFSMEKALRYGSITRDEVLALRLRGVDATLLDAILEKGN